LSILQFCFMCFSVWNTIWFSVVDKMCCCSSDAFVDNCAIVCWWVVFCSCDYNSIITCNWYCDFISDVIWICSCYCSSNTIRSYEFDYRFDVIWVWSYCFNFDTCSIWPNWSCGIINSSCCICSPISMAVDAYLWELTSYKTYSTCSRVCSTTSLSRLSFPPLRFPGSFTTFVHDCLAPSISFFFSSSSEVFSYGNKIKAHTQMMA
jgi:hypothetical protein